MKTDQLIETLKKQISSFEGTIQTAEVGTVVELGDGIARMTGLQKCQAAEMLEFPGGTLGVALNLEQETVGAILFGEYKHIKEGDTVKRTGRILSIPVGDAFLGRVVNPLGEVIDGGAKLVSDTFYPIEKIAPGVMTREPVTTPVQTGLKAIDAMIPIGRGQRELIIGDRQTGKTAVAIDTIINQKGKNLICIYVAIGQKESKIARIVAKLKEEGAMDHTILVVAGASDSASLNFIAPYAGSTLAEYFMDKGTDVLVVYDDLSKHAWAYREISLLLRRPPGREAYPGDVFYLHSRLLERACRLNKENGGGSITALPIIETQAGDVTAYIPTNVISITDGQIYLESDLFYRGIRPALNVGLSVSRVGSAAQIKPMKKVAGKLRLSLAQFRELESFAQFASDLDPATKQQIERGARIVEVLKQLQFEPMPVAEQVAILYAVTNGYLDTVPLNQVKEWETKFLAHFNATASKLAETIAGGAWDDKVENQLKEIIQNLAIL
ncbi:MAG: F0F1 ATP synthase subunit alpha [Candidatus Magasanikbacteria bacterium]|nr:F0F1 ATP synthase subunit alpha [Candidatus Magasanikbacteria bacterium]